MKNNFSIIVDAWRKKKNGFSTYCKRFFSNWRCWNYQECMQRLSFFNFVLSKIWCFYFLIIFNIFMSNNKGNKFYSRHCRNTKYVIFIMYRIRDKWDCDYIRTSTPKWSSKKTCEAGLSRNLSSGSYRTAQNWTFRKLWGKNMLQFITLIFYNLLLF